jgi:TolB-like protein/Flp pilus assembly protein TadD
VISTTTAARTPSNDIATEKTRVAVLPFDNLSGHPEDRWLATAFADSLTFGLQARGNLLPVSRHGIGNYQDRSRDETECLEAIDGFCRSLGARYYVDGSYHKVGDELRVVARLVEVGSGNILTQERATGRTADLLQLEDELARGFGGSLESGGVLTSSRADVASADTRRTLKEGQGLYASGRMNETLEAAKRAVELAPGNAEAWALLGKSYARLAGSTFFSGGSRHVYQTQALAAATRAVGLACSSYEAHVAVALACRELGRVKPWRAAARKAIALGPWPAEAYVLLGDSYWENAFWGYLTRGNGNLAVSHSRQAVLLDPTVQNYWQCLTMSFMWAGRAEEGVRVAYEGLRLHPASSVIRTALVFVLLSLGRLDEAQRVLNDAIAGRTPALELQARQATIDLWRGRPEAAAVFRKVVDVGPREWHVVIARAYLVAGMVEAALTHLEQACKADPAWAQWLFATRSPYWEPVHTNREVLSLLGDYGAS